MNKFTLMLACLMCAMGCASIAPGTHANVHDKAMPKAGGKLLVVGGALTSSNAQVYRAFIDHAQGGDFAIVPVASGKPVRYAHQFKRDLMRYGVDEQRIHLVPLAVKDDPDTDRDESTWARNAYSASVVESLAQVRHFWFVGGDQTRITQTLLDENGSDSPLLAHIRKQLAGGGMVGGTSAGAAMMSERMIAAGDSVSALLKPVTADYAGMAAQENGALYLSQGLGFWPGVLVDQHFDRKARLGRLAAALCEVPGVDGIGIDEDTAALVDLHTGEVTALGRGNVTLLSAESMACDWRAGQRSIANLNLTLMSRGDLLLLSNHRFTPAQGKDKTRGDEAFGGKALVGGGMAVGNQRLDELLGFDLLDNADAAEVERWTQVTTKTGIASIRYLFAEQPESQGYWGYVDGTKDMYSAHKVRFSILPGAELMPTEDAK